MNCPLLEEICWDFEQTPDHKFHFENKSFLEQHLDARANLGHTKDLHFIKLVAECAKGNPDSFNAMADYFESMAAVPGASAFYIYASNYWRYRAFSKGNLSARSWFDKWFAANPGKRLPSILRENSYGREGRYKHEIEGKMLNDLGFPFFDAKRYYEIKILDSVGLAEVSAFSDYDGPDESGFGAETFYDWWYLDENLTPIPGVHSIHSRSVRDKRTFSEDFHIQYQKAANAVRSRKLERPSEHCQD